jgi:predicted amidophosphoribosyltransferase
VRGADAAKRGWLASISDALVSVFFPAGCRICDMLLTSASRVPICGACLASFVPVPQPSCEVCGRPLPGLTPEPGRALLCPACRDKTYAFERARSFAVYEGALVQAILLLKYEQIEPLGRGSRSGWRGS